VAARLEGGPFRDLPDLARRLDPRQVNKRTIEALIAAGALDQLELNRARSTAAVDGIMALANRTKDAASGGQSELFGGNAVEVLRIPPVEMWPVAEKLRKEHEAVGFFLSGHPLDEYELVLKRMRVQRFADFARTVRAAGVSMARVAASVIDRSERRTRTGNKMGIVQFSDQSGHFDAVLFAEGLQKFRDLLEPGKAVVLRLSATADGDEVKARIEDVEPLDLVAAKQKQDLCIFLRDDKALSSISERLKERGEGKVSVVMILDNGAQEVEIELPGRFAINAQSANAMRAVPGVVNVEVR
jgi:DNA polymerase III subunit alpha